MYNFTIYFINGKKKTVNGVDYFKVELNYVKLNLKNHKSLIFPFSNVSHVEIEGLFDDKDVEATAEVEED